MNGSIELDFGHDSVRFTPDGMVFIEDAIKALISSEEEKPSAVWKKLEKENPDILEHCSSYETEEGELIKTIDIEGLDKIFLLLPDYI